MPLADCRYNLGFTAFGLGSSQLLELATLFVELNEDWQEVRKAAIRDNIFRQSKESSLIRLEREFRLRLETLTANQTALLVESPSEARVPIALLAVFKRYRFVRDYAEGVLREKAEVFDFEVRPSDYSSFVEQQEPAHPELAELSDSTAKKIRQITHRILTEGEILSDTVPQRIAPAVLSQQVIAVIRDEDLSLLPAFLQPTP